MVSQGHGPYTFDLGLAWDSTTLLCSLCKMGLIVEAPAHKAMVKKKEKHNRSLCRAWHPRRGHVGTNNPEKGLDLNLAISSS